MRRDVTWRPIAGRAVPLLGIALLCPELTGILDGVAAAPPGERLPLRHIEGPPPGHTGGFGEPSCHVCHDELPLNDPDDDLRLFTVGEGEIRAGDPILLGIRMRSLDMEAAGFQASVRIADGPSAGSQAGRLSAVDERVRVIRDERGIEYAQHTESGTTVEAELIRWTFAWTPPAGVDRVLFHASVNSANGDNSPLGDFIHTLEMQIEIR